MRCFWGTVLLTTIPMGPRTLKVPPLPGIKGEKENALLQLCHAAMAAARGPSGGGQLPLHPLHRT